MSTQENTEILQPDAAGIGRAAQLLSEGRLVAFPTETVYGLGGDARNDQAVAAIFAAKERPSFNPLIVHVASLEDARKFAPFDKEAESLAQAFWPGPLTLVLPLADNAPLSPLVTAGQPSVAIRVPEHPVARELLAAFKGPVAAPSANPSGRISPTRADHVLDGLGGRIAAVVDGGACAVGLESTIVAPGRPARLLRPGGLPVEVISQCLGQPVAIRGEHEGISAPGQLRSHYAPRATLRLEATEPRAGEVMLGFGSVGGDLNLSASGDLVEAAANLFHALRELDGKGQPIAVAPVPETGLGIAINDRLRRAAAPRD